MVLDPMLFMLQGSKFRHRGQVALSAAQGPGRDCRWEEAVPSRPARN